jgi:septal ring factor EnvC (AmiA/AmiB activator)
MSISDKGYSMKNEYSHLEAIEDRIIRERQRLLTSRTENEKRFRALQILSAEKEKAQELDFLEKRGVDVSVYRMTDEEIYAELMK